MKALLILVILLLLAAGAAIGIDKLSGEPNYVEDYSWPVSYQDFDLQCLGFQYEMVIRNESEYQSAINTSTDLYPNPFLLCIDYKFPKIDFDQNTLLGHQVVTAGCSADFTRSIRQLDLDAMVIYEIKYSSSGSCDKAISNNNFVLIPKIPENYEVRFEVTKAD